MVSGQPTSSFRSFSPEDEALLFDVFLRVLRELVEPEELARYSLEGFTVSTYSDFEGSHLWIRTGVGYEITVDWDGSIADALKETINAASTVALDM
jgi:hypothetical protein